MFCSNCGQKIEEGERYCSGCGTGTGAAQAAVKGTGLSPELKKMLIVLAGLLVVLLIVFLVVSPFGGGQSSPKAAIESFMKAFQSGNARQLLNLLDPEITEELKQYGGEEYFISIMNEFISEAQILNYRVNSVRQTSDTRAVAEVYVKIRWYDGEIEEDTSDIDLVKRGGKWYIADMF